MTIYISGGSNSLIQGGWVHKLRERLPQEQDLKNISIGAAPSQMGAFRCYHTIDLKKGDTVIWEYGVNDANHIDARGYSNAELRKALEWTIRLCREREAKFAAMIFQPRDREKRQRVTQYRKMVHRVCSRYGVGFFDVQLAFLAQNPDKKCIPPQYFNGNAHYRVRDDLMTLIADGAMDLLTTARVPGRVPGRASGALKIYASFDGGTVEEFSNRAVSLPTWRPGPKGLTATLAGAGRIVGLVMTSTPKGGVFDLSIGGTTVRLSATYREKDFNKTLLKFVSIPTLYGEEIAFDAGTPVSISWADTTEDMLVDYRFAKRVGPSALTAREAGVVAILTEE